MIEETKINNPEKYKILMTKQNEKNKIYTKQALEQLKKEHPEGSVPVPPHWGGLRIKPQKIEFWQGRPNRLHDRFVYQKTAQGWSISRLQP